MNPIKTHLSNPDACGLYIEGPPRSGKTQMVKDKINNLSYINTLIISNKNEYSDHPLILTTHIKISPTMLRGFLYQCHSLYKVPNIIIDKTHSISSFYRLFDNAMSRQYESRFTKIVVFDDLTQIMPANIIIIGMTRTFPIFVFQSFNHLTEQLKKLVETRCNASINITTKKKVRKFNIQSSIEAFNTIPFQGELQRL